jgi:hypothetical protein
MRTVFSRAALVLLCGLLFQSSAFAQSGNCLRFFELSVSRMEAAAGTANLCRKADQLELALNAAGTAQSSCTGRERETINRHIARLSDLLARAVAACGR